MKEGSKLKTMAAIVFISSEYGLEHHLIREGSIKKHDIIESLQGLLAKHSGHRVTLFMDNLRGHNSKEVQ